MAPSVREQPARQGRRLDDTERYLRDAKHAAAGAETGPKFDFGGMVNMVSEDWKGAVKEMAALEASYGGDGQVYAHWSISLKEGERWTPATAQVAVEIFLRHQGLEGHQTLWSVHNDTKNHHIHLLMSRIRPEPGPDGKTYEIAYEGGSIVNPTSGHTYTHESGHAAEAEIRATQSWAREKKAEYDMIDGKIVKAQYAPDPADRDKIKLGVKIERIEAQTGEKHPKRIMAEQAVSIIRAANGDKPTAVAMLAAQGIRYEDMDYLDAKGRRHLGGQISGEAGEVKISALPKADRWIAKQPAVAVQAPAEKAAKPVKASLSQVQNNGQVPPYAISHDVMSSVNASSEIMHGKGANDATNMQRPPVPTLKEAATAILVQEGKTETETLEALGAQGITLTRETGTDAKTGNAYVYGRLSRDGEKPISLRQLGLDDAGKPLFSLPILDRQFLIADARPVLAATAGTGRTATAAALLASGITLSEVSKVIKGEDGTEKTVRYGQLERAGITVALGAIAKGEDGKAVYTLGQMEKAEREIKQGDLRAEALPLIQAQARTGWDDAVKACAAQGIKLSEEPAIIKDKAGVEKEIVYARLERDGISVSLKSLTGTDGKALFSARELQRTALAQDAARIIDAHGSYAAAEPAMLAANINYERLKITVTGKDGEEKIVTVGRLERDGVTTTTGHAGKEYGIAALDSRYLPTETARSLYLEARTQEKPVQYLAQKGLTASDIDRVGRVGEKLEKGIQRGEKPAAVAKPTAQAPAIGKSIIPHSVQEILDLIAESAQQAAALASANARAAQAATLARRAEAKAAKAEEALAALKASIRHEEKTTKPAPQGPKEQQAMADGIGGMTHAPETKKQVPLAEGQEKAVATAQTDQDRDAAQAVQAPAQVEDQQVQEAPAEVAEAEAPKKKLGWLAQHAEEARADAQAGAEAARPMGGPVQDDQYNQQTPNRPTHGPRM